MFAELRNRFGTNYANYTIITRSANLTFDSQYLDVGAISFSVTQQDAAALGIGDQSVIEVAPNGQSHNNLWYGIDGTSGSYVADDTLWVTLSGKSIVNWLADGLVYPSSWPTIPTVNPDGTTTPVVAGFSFQNATPGTIIQTLIARVVERGGFEWVNVSSFTGATTSDAVGWSTTLTTTYSTGTTVLQVLQDLASRQLIQFTMTGMSLNLYNYNSQIVYHTPETVTFRSGANILEQTTNTDSSTVATAVLIEGDNSTIAEVVSPTALAQQGRRREAYVSQGGITDIPTLTMLATTQLAIAGHVQNEETLGVEDNLLLPWLGYDIGDWVWEDKNGTLVNLQIQQIAGTMQDANNMTIGLTLGDIIDSEDAKLQERLDNITGQNAGNYGGLPNSTQDFIAPEPPTDLQAIPTAYRDASGNDFDQITITWVAPAINVDGSPVTDLDHYDVQYQLNDAGVWQSAAATPAQYNAAYVSTLPTGQSFLCQVRAVDSSGNASLWTVLSPEISSLPPFLDVPPTPSTPQVAQALRGIMVTWDGLDSNGNVYDSSLAAVNIYVGTTSNFVPSTTNLEMAFASRGGTLNVTGLDYNTDYYVIFVALDKSGNYSLPSAESASIQTGQLSDPDLPDKLVTGAKVADAAISTAQLTVSAFGASVVPNGSFEDAATKSGEIASHWMLGQSTGPTGSSTVTYDTGSGDAATGNACLQIVLTGVGNQWIINSDDIATTTDDLWYVNFKIKASRALGNVVNAYLSFGESGSTLPIVGDPANPLINVFTANATTEWVMWDGQALAPDAIGSPLTKMRIILEVNTPTDAAPITIYLDDVNVEPVHGSASIMDLSVVDAKINDMSVDKITAGTLSADVVVGSRIKTSDTGARVEMNSSGIQAYDANGNQTLAVNDSDGSVSMTGELAGGSLDFPALSTPSSFRIHADASGFNATGAGVTNLLHDPSFEAQSYILSPKNSHTTGAYDTSYDGITEYNALSGVTSLKITTDGSDTAGYVSVPVGIIQPNTVYVFSVHAAIAPNSVTTENLNFNMSVFSGTVTGITTPLFTGADGWYAFDGSSTGTSLPNTALKALGNYSGLVAVTSGEYATIQDANALVPPGGNAQTSFTRRFFKSFKTSVSVPINSTLIVDFPVGTAASGTQPTTWWDGMQLESVYELPSTYTDGSLQDCLWTGSANASTSTRGSSSLFQLVAGSPPLFASGFSRGMGGSFGTNAIEMTRSIQTSVLTSTWTIMPWNFIPYAEGNVADNGVFYAAGGNFTVIIPGWYFMSATCYFNAAPRQILRWVSQSSSIELARTVSNSGIVDIFTCTTMKYLPAGTIFNFQLWQNSGSTVVLPAHIATEPEMVSVGLLL